MHRYHCSSTVSYYENGRRCFESLFLTVKFIDYLTKILSKIVCDLLNWKHEWISSTWLTVPSLIHCIEIISKLTKFLCKSTISCYIIAEIMNKENNAPIFRIIFKLTKLPIVTDINFASNTCLFCLTSFIFYFPSFVWIWAINFWNDWVDIKEILSILTKSNHFLIMHLASKMLFNHHFCT